MTSNSPRRDQTLRLLSNIVTATLKDIPVRVYLFGSWARKQEKRTSDIDIAFQSNQEIPMKIWVELREQIEDSAIPYNVDLVDLSKANPVFVEKVKKEGIVWKNYMNESSSQTKC